MIVQASALEEDENDALDTQIDVDEWKLEDVLANERFV
jgi:hypothetical protein